MIYYVFGCAAAAAAVSAAAVSANAARQRGPRLQESYDFCHQSEKQNGLWRPFCIKMLKELVGSLTLS